jgi:hypothetical protein
VITEVLSIETEQAAAEQALAQGRYEVAEYHFRRLIAHAHVVDYEYDEWARRLAGLYGTLGRAREAGLLYLYLHLLDPARAAFRHAASPVDLARVAAVERRWGEAAEAFLEGGAVVQAAVACEEGMDHARARDLWRRLAADPRLRLHPYERALVHFDAGMAALRAAGDDDRAAGRADLVLAQRLLEEVADDYETRGLRERAFDCYQILLKLGRDSGAFENLAEGYVNCVRVLRDDGLKFYALQYYEDFLELAVEAGELGAAAQIAREAAEYAVRAGLPYDRHYLRRAAEIGWRAAETHLEAGAPLDLVESAWLASIDCWSAVGDFPRVVETYERLAALELPERRSRRYAGIAERFRDAPADPRESPAFPAYLRQRHAYGDVWFADLIEWEMDGDPDPVAAAIVGDLRYPDVFRRRAVNLLLLLSDARLRKTDGEPAVLAEVARWLGELQSYPALRPLERLFGHGDARVRQAAIRALRYLHFKRSFGLVGRALVDPDPGVRQAALEALGRLHFPHAFQPLARIFREHADPEVRAAALGALGRIGSVEAAELLVGVLRHEPGPAREAARRALAAIDNPDVLPILREHRDLEPDPEVRGMLAALAIRRDG